MAEWGVLRGGLPDKSKGLTAVAEDIISGKTALVDGNILTGVLVSNKRSLTGTGSVRENGSYTDIPFYGLDFYPNELIVVRTETGFDNFMGAVKLRGKNAKGYFKTKNNAIEEYSGNISKQNYYGNSYTLRLGTGGYEGSNVVWIAIE